MTSSYNIDRKSMQQNSKSEKIKFDLNELMNLQKQLDSKKTARDKATKHIQVPSQGGRPVRSSFK